MKHLNALKKAIVAGVLIGIGCTVYLNMDNSIAASFLFGLGLFTIINLELNLFTGKIGYLGKNNYIEILITLIGNAIGVNIMAFLIKQTRLNDRLVEKAIPIVDNKLSDTYISLFLLAVFCGMLMFIAVATFKKQPNILGTLAVFLCVSVFILAGFEHCIANMGIFTVAFCLVPGLSLGAMAKSMLIVTLGNMIGGAVLLAWPLRKMSADK